MAGSVMLVIASLGMTNEGLKDFDRIIDLVRPVVVCELPHDLQILSKRRAFLRQSRQALFGKDRDNKRNKAIDDARNSLAKEIEAIENKKSTCGRDQAIASIKARLVRLNPDADPIYNEWYAKGVFDDVKEAATWIYKYENNVWPPRPIAPAPARPWQTKSSE